MYFNQSNKILYDIETGEYRYPYRHNDDHDENNSDYNDDNYPESENNLAIIIVLGTAFAALYFLL